jgi:hypothetical protein
VSERVWRLATAPALNPASVSLSVAQHIATGDGESTAIGMSLESGTGRNPLENRTPNHHLGRLAVNDISHAAFSNFQHSEDAMNVKTQIKAGCGWDDTIIWGS